MIVDSPPGTGDEPLSIVQLLTDHDGAVIVTTQQQLSIDDVKKCINFCRKVYLRILGVIENMSGFVCPDCGSRVDIFSSDDGRKMAEEMRVPFLGSIPIERKIVDAGEKGRPYIDLETGSPTAKVFNEIVRQLDFHTIK